MSKTDTTKPRRTRRIDVARRPLRWAAMGRTREGEMYRSVLRQLRQHVGAPSLAQEMLIGRIAWLSVHLARLDEKAITGDTMNDHDAKQYLAWANSLSRMLQALGLQAPAAPKLEWSEVLAALSAPGADDDGEDV